MGLYLCQLQLFSFCLFFNLNHVAQPPMTGRFLVAILLPVSGRTQNNVTPPIWACL